MNRKELQDIIDKAVEEVISKPMTEPQMPVVKKKPYKPALQTEDDVDDYLFYAGNKSKY